jgi:hypothetical protein
MRKWDGLAALCRAKRDDRVMAEYGLPVGPHPDHEIDHLIPLETVTRLTFNKRAAS